LGIEKLPFPENDLQPQENIYACFILQTMKMKYLFPIQSALRVFKNFDPD